MQLCAPVSALTPARFTPLDYSKSVPKEVPIPSPRPSYVLGVADAEAAVRDIAAGRPDIAQVVDYGDSGEKAAGTGGHDLLALQFRSPEASEVARSRVVVTAGIHPREVVPPAVVMELAERLAAGYGSDPRITKLLDAVDIDLVPVANPDGLEVVERGLRGEPGSTHLQRGNTTAPHGVNLNRNFATGWDDPFDGKPFNGMPNDMHDPLNMHGNWSGRAPDSEPETQALQSLLAARPTSLYLDLHTRGDFVLWAFGGTPAVEQRAGRIATQLAKTIDTGNGFTEAHPQTVPSGMAIDWAQAELGIPSVLAEIGGRSFFPQDAEYEGIAKRVLPGVLEALEGAAGLTRGAAEE